MIAETVQQLEMFHLNYNRYPLALDDLASPVPPAYIEPGRWQPLLTKPPRDGWGRPLIYRVPGERGLPFELVSYGEDGLEGGEGFAADLR